ncbi:MAG: hypothetical protein DYG98_01640 [Haliscomenobacteraceae bacterium CHB4]|nr:hypothetical protein [Saprospiraceae bacterium]MCE7921734.1 hypothetical protein [Haliscomenobacteraceae bacterium CHB4]
MRSVFLALAHILVISVAAPAQHYYYTPNSIHIPVLKEKGDAAAGIGMGWGNDYFAPEGQVVYSPVQHGAVMVNGFLAGNPGVRDDTEIGASFRFVELGVGAYQALERGSASVFAGVGQGNLYNYYGNDNFSSFRVRRYFVQPGLMYEDKYFRCGLALRLTRISYPKGESSFDINENELAAIRKIEEDAPFFMPELGLSGGIEITPCVLSVNITSVFPDAPGLNFSRFNMNLTLSFDFGKMKKMKKGEN